MNRNELTLSIYIDAMKAYDTVNHQILLKKIEYFGITGKNANWVKNYLNERKQCTHANNVLSNEEIITCGVPQGSVCGPLLFLLYINDISKVLNKCKVSKYLTKRASTTVFKTMILSLIEYGDIIYSGTNKSNMDKIVNLFYRGLRICDNTNNNVSKENLCRNCHIAPLNVRKDMHLLLFMHKQSNNEDLIKKNTYKNEITPSPCF